MNFYELSKFSLLKQSSTSFNWEDLKHKYSSDQENHRIDLFNKSGAVGNIEWSKDDGEVSSINVGTPYRRIGLGTHLWELATEMSEENGWESPQHSSRRSESGDYFAESIGGYIPPLTDDIDGWSQRTNRETD